MIADEPVNEEADKLLKRSGYEFEGNQGGESGYFLRKKEYTITVSPSGNWRCHQPTVYDEALIDEGPLEELGEFLYDNQ